MPLSVQNLKSRFGCRILAAKTGTPTSDSTLDLLRACFVGRSPTSFVNQAKPNRAADPAIEELFTKRKKQLDGRPTTHYHETPQELAYSKRYYDMILKLGSNEGCGIAGSNGYDVADFRRPEPVEQTDFNGQFVKLLIWKADTIGAHLRATQNRVRLKNTHPFACGDWRIMHNGNVPKLPLPEIIPNKERPDLVAMLQRGPIGESDSEHALHYFLRTLFNKFGKLNAGQIGYDNVKPVFEEVMKTFIKAANATNQQKGIKPDLNNWDYLINAEPTCNFVLWDPHVMLAYRRGPDLYKGHTPDRTTYFIASEPPRILVKKQNEKIIWELMRNDEAVVLHREGSRIMDGTPTGFPPPPRLLRGLLSLQLVVLKLTKLPS